MNGALLVLILSTVQAAPAFSPADLAEIHVRAYNRGAAYMDMKRYKAAAREFETIAEAEPRAAFARLHQGAALIRARAHFRALKPLRAAVELSPRDPRPLYLLARANLALRRFDDAGRALKAAATIDPNEASLRYYLGTARAGLKDVAGAEKAYREALAIDPGHVQARYRLGQLLIASGRKEKGSAMLKEYYRLRGPGGTEPDRVRAGSSTSSYEELERPDFGPAPKEGSEGPRLEVRLTGRKKADSVVRVRAGRLFLEKKLGPSPGSFDLGGRAKADSVAVLWPDGTRLIRVDVPADRPLEIEKKRRRGVGHRF